MQKRILGSSGIEISPIGIGCMGFSHGYGQIPEQEYSIEAIRAAKDFGCNFFDTAEAYGSQLYHMGHNEEILGEAVKDFRKEVVLATKFHFAPEDYAPGADRYEAVRGHLLRSLKRLQTDYVDLYYLHRVSAEVSVEESAEIMGRLIQEGLIRGWGMSQVDVDTLAKAHAVTPVSAVQNLYNMLERDCEQDIFPFCLEHKICVVPFSPVASGFLSGKITADTKFEKVDDVRNWVPQLSRENIVSNQPVLDVLNRFSEEKGATNAQISMAWMLHKYENCVPIPGSKNKERILENLSSWNVTLTDGEFEALEAALNACEIHGHRGHVEMEGIVRKNINQNQ